MELLIFDTNLQYVGVVDFFTSLRWVRKYSKPGEFELHVPLDECSLNLLKKDFIIYKKGDNEAAYIETRQMGVSSSGEETLQLKGKFLSNYLDRRILWGYESFSNTKAEIVMRTIVDKHCITPDSEKRKIPFLSLGEFKGDSAVITILETSYKQVLQIISDIADASDLGYKIAFDYNTPGLMFEVYRGMDRTNKQSQNSQAIFSREFENVLEQTYLESSSNLRNACLVIGGSRYPEANVLAVGDASGINRYETFLDEKNLSDKKTTSKAKVGANGAPLKDSNGNLIYEEDQTDMTADEYKDLLETKGNEKIQECSEIKTFEAKVNVNSNLRYKEDFDLGDIVTIRDKKLGLVLDTRIIEVEEIYENGYEDVNLTFGKSILTLWDKLKQNLR